MWTIAARDSQSEQLRLAFFVGFGLLIGLTLSSVFVSSAVAQTTSPPIPLAVSPGSVLPGQTVHVSVTGLAGLPIAGQTGCLGILGPGQNVELNLSPAFRPQIGTLAISANGSGQSDAVIPADLVPGSYRLILGPCSPNGSIAPLAMIAQAEIQVAAPKPQPVPVPTRTPLPKLPATGGVPTVVFEGIAAAGGFALVLGLWLRWRTRRASPPNPDSPSRPPREKTP